MYQASRALSYGLNYAAHKHYVGSEVMFFGRRLSIPDEQIPQSTVAAGVARRGAQPQRGFVQRADRVRGQPFLTGRP